MFLRLLTFYWHESLLPFGLEAWGGPELLRWPIAVGFHGVYFTLICCPLSLNTIPPVFRPVHECLSVGGTPGVGAPSTWQTTLLVPSLRFPSQMCTTRSLARCAQPGHWITTWLLASVSDRQKRWSNYTDDAGRAWIEGPSQGRGGGIEGSGPCVLLGSRRGRWCVAACVGRESQEVIKDR